MPTLIWGFRLLPNISGQKYVLYINSIPAGEKKNNSVLFSESEIVLLSVSIVENFK